MTDLAQRLDNAKKEIRSLLLSAPLGLTLQELQGDYQQFLGTQLPWRPLGYNSPEEFIQDLPDTVQVSWNGSTMVLRGVSDASTQHIQKLVANQKVDSKKKKRTLLGRKGGSPFLPAQSSGSRWRSSGGSRGGRTGGGSLHRTGWQSGPRVGGRGWQSGPRAGGGGWEEDAAPPRSVPPGRGGQAKHRTVAQVPAYVRAQIQELVSSYADGLPLTHICQIFRSRFGVTLDPLAMGFVDSHDLVSSLRDMVALRRLEGGEMRVVALAGRGVNVKVNEGVMERVNTGQGRPHRADSHGGAGSMLGRRTDSVSPGEVSEKRGPSSDVNSDKENVEESCNIPDVIQGHIAQIFDKRPKGIFASRLPFEYKAMFRTELPFKTFGYNSVIEFVSDLPHIVRTERPHPQGDWHLFPVSLCVDSVKTCQDVPAGKSVRATFRPVEQEVKDTITQTLQMNVNGVPLERFLHTYERMTGHSLCIEQYGDGDLKAFLHSLVDILYISLDALDRPVVCSKVSQAPRRFDRLDDQYQPTTSPALMNPDCILHLPPDAVSPGCKYVPLSVPEVSDNYITLLVSFVVSPALFWIQLRSHRNTVALEDLMDELEMVYSHKRLPKGYALTPELAETGMVCAAIFPEDGHWHRAIITGVKDKLYQVYYVDYGNTCLISLDNMKLLKTKFLRLPVQAVQARLSNIQPQGEQWLLSSRDRMLTLCRDTPLLGLVTSVQGRVLSLCLVDTTREEDVHINDALVLEGYARFSPDHQTDRQTDRAGTASQAPTQAPTHSLLYGEGAQSVQLESVSSEPARRYVRQAKVSEDLILHLINLEDELYLLSSEISALFFSQDVLSSKLKQNNVDIPHRVVSTDSHSHLFQELLMYEAPSISRDTSLLSLYPLCGVPLIISLYSSPGQHDELKDLLLDILHWFDPDHPFWRGEEEEEEGGESGSSLTGGTQEEEEEEEECVSREGGARELPCVQDLQMAVNTLVIKRKRILHKMVCPEGCTSDNVNELNQVELTIKSIQHLLAKRGEAVPGSQTSNIARLDDDAGVTPREVATLIRPPGTVPATDPRPSATVSAAPCVQPQPQPQPQPLSSAAQNMPPLLQQRQMLLSGEMTRQPGVLTQLPMSGTAMVEFDALQQHPQLLEVALQQQLQQQQQHLQHQLQQQQQQLQLQLQQQLQQRQQSLPTQQMSLLASQMSALRLPGQVTPALTPGYDLANSWMNSQLAASVLANDSLASLASDLPHPGAQYTSQAHSVPHPGAQYTSQAHSVPHPGAQYTSQAHSVPHSGAQYTSQAHSVPHSGAQYTSKVSARSSLTATHQAGTGLPGGPPRGVWPIGALMGGSVLPPHASLPPPHSRLPPPHTRLPPPHSVGRGSDQRATQLSRPGAPGDWPVEANL